MWETLASGTGALELRGPDVVDVRQSCGASLVPTPSFLSLVGVSREGKGSIEP